MIDEVQDSTLIIEIWQIKPELSPKKSHFVILLMDGSHFCTCNLLISFGIPCRHFYKVLRKSSQAKFHIKLINQRWYQDIKFSMSDDDLALLDTISLVENNYTEVTITNEINFKHINQVRGKQVYTEKLQNIVSAKAKYGRSLGLARKVLDLAQKLDCFNEANGMFQNFIDDKQQELLQKHQEVTNKVDEKENEIECSNPITSRRRERPPNRYLSEGEAIKQKKMKGDHAKSEVNLSDNKEINVYNKKQRRCKGCQETGHDLRNCKAKILSEKN